MQQFSLVIHGGAGTILKEDMSPKLEQAKWWFCSGCDSGVYFYARK